MYQVKISKCKSKHDNVYIASPQKIKSSPVPLLQDIILLVLYL